MKKLLGFVFIFGLLTGLAFSEITVTVTKPAAGDVWYKGLKYTIEWTLSGGLVLGNARVTAIHPLTKAELLVISPDWPKTKPISFTVPGNAPLGNLRIRVQIKGTNTFGDSGVFEVKELKIKPIKPPKTLKQPNPKITVTTPSSLSRYQLDQEINISWEINYLGRSFELELYDLDGINQFAPYPHIFSGYCEPIDSNGKKFRFRWKIPKYISNYDYSGGQIYFHEGGGPAFTIRVRSLEKPDLMDLSDPFVIYMGIRKTATLLPASIKNYEAQPPGCFHQVAPQFQNMPGTTRVGHYSFEAPPPNLTGKLCGFIFRSHIVFSFLPLANKLKQLIEAKIILEPKKHQSKLNSPSCADSLICLNEPISDVMHVKGGAIHVPQLKTITIVDVTHRVADWLTGARLNNGFLLVGGVVTFLDSYDFCVTWFNCKLEIKYIEKVN